MPAKSLVYNSSSRGGWTPCRSWNTWGPRLRSLPLARGITRDELKINNKEEDKDVDTEFIGAKSCKPKDKDDDNNDTENTNKKDLPGACQREGKGSVTKP